MCGHGVPALMARLRLRAEHETWMMMSGLIALCALIVVGGLVLPIFGPRVAAITAVAVVSIIVVICYFICIPRAVAWLASDHLHGGTRRDG